MPCALTSDAICYPLTLFFSDFFFLYICQLLIYLTITGELFYWMQKSMERPTTDCLKTLADVGRYILQGRSHTRWEELLSLWYVNNTLSIQYTLESIVKINIINSQ